MDDAERLRKTSKRGMPRDRSPDDPPLPIDDRPLVDWIPAVISGAGSPVHLEPFPTMLDRAIDGEPMRVLCSCPIRHWKSATVKAAIAKAIRKKPRLHIIVMTHTHDFAQSYGRELRELCRSVGIRIKRGADTILNWETEEGGGVFVMSEGQSALGRPCDIFIFDDPFSSFDEANNPDVRDHVDWVIMQYTARLNAGGSVLGIMSRLHPDDAIGRRLTRQAREWISIHKAALIDEGKETERSLAPHVMSLEHLRKVRAELAEGDPSEMTWHSQFQNDPRETARGLFRGEHEWSGELTEDRIAIGVDAAFSVGKSRDYFAAVVLRKIGDVFVVSHVVRHQRGTIAMAETLTELRARHPGAHMFAYVSGPEVGAYHQLAKDGVMVHRMPARWDKEYRARASAAAWELGRVRYVTGEPWTGPFLRELHSFTGAANGQDDQVDALVAAYDGMQRGLSGSLTTFKGGIKRVM